MKTREAFLWITNILNKHGVPYQIIGGLAARLYGAKRELVDIDLGIQENRMEELLPELGPFITFGPKHYIDNEWDVPILITLVYQGIEIDLPCADTMRIFNKENSQWQQFNFDINNGERLSLYNERVQVIPRNDLIAYKKILGRAVDISDVRELE